MSEKNILEYYKGVDAEKNLSKERGEYDLPVFTGGLHVEDFTEELKETEVVEVDGFKVYLGLWRKDWGLYSYTEKVLDNLQCYLDVSLPTCTPSTSVVGSPTDWPDLPEIGENEDDTETLEWYTTFSGALDVLDISSENNKVYTAEAWHGVGPITYKLEKYVEEGYEEESSYWQGVYFGSDTEKLMDVSEKIVLEKEDPYTSDKVVYYGLKLTDTAWGNWRVTASDLKSSIHQILRVDGTHDVYHLTWVTEPYAEVDTSTSYPMAVKYYAGTVSWRIIDKDGVVHSFGRPGDTNEPIQGGWSITTFTGKYHQNAVLVVGAEAEGKVTVQATDEPFPVGSDPVYNVKAECKLSFDWNIMLSSLTPLVANETYGFSVKGPTGDTTWYFRLYGGDWTAFGEINGLTFTKLTTLTGSLAIGAYFRGRSLDLKVEDSSTPDADFVTDLYIDLPCQFFGSASGLVYNLAEASDGSVRSVTRTSSGQLRTDYLEITVVESTSVVGGVTTLKTKVSKWWYGAWVELTEFGELTKTTTVEYTYVGSPGDPDYRRIKTTEAGSQYIKGRRVSTSSTYNLINKRSYSAYTTTWADDGYGNNGHYIAASGHLTYDYSYMSYSGLDVPAIAWSTDFDSELVYSEGSVTNLESGYFVQWIDYKDEDNFIVRLTNGYLTTSTAIKYEGLIDGESFEFVIPRSAVDMEAVAGNNYLVSNMSHGWEA